MNNVYKIEESKNIELINSILFDENIYPYLVTDESWKRDMNILNCDNLKFFIFFCDKIPIGLCIFVQITNNVSIIHFGALENFRGRQIYILAKKMLEMYFNNTDCHKIVCRIRKYNKKSIFFAIHNGFKVLGENGIYKYLEVSKYGRFT